MTFKQRLLLAVAPYAWWQRYVLSMVAIMLLVFSWYSVRHRVLSRVLAPAAVTQESIPCSIGNAARVSADFFTCDNQHACIEQIFQQCAQQGLTVRAYDKLTQDVRSTYRTVELSFSVCGDFFHLIDFLHDLAQYRNLRPERIELLIDHDQILCHSRWLLYSRS